MFRYSSALLGGLSVLLICSCTSTNLHRAYCSALKSDIVFNAATSNPRKADIERSEEPLEAHTYNVNDCDRVTLMHSTVHPKAEAIINQLHHS